MISSSNVTIYELHLEGPNSGFDLVFHFKSKSEPEFANEKSFEAVNVVMQYYSSNFYTSFSILPYNFQNEYNS